jgi:hypothetical protein
MKWAGSIMFVAGALALNPPSGPIATAYLFCFIAGLLAAMDVGAKR